MRIRKLLLVIAALLMVATLAAACGGSDEEGQAPSDVNAPETSGTQAQSAEDKANAPDNPTLDITVPSMERIKDAPVPDTTGDDEDSLRDYVGIHLEGTGFPWQKEANVYIAGHRLGFPGTNSWLAFWDLNVLHKGDMIYLRDAAGDRYAYRVFRRFIVGPNQVSVTRPLPGRNIVSLQTCTLPDYSDRLIVQAEKVSKQ